MDIVIRNRKTKSGGLLSVFIMLLLCYVMLYRITALCKMQRDEITSKMNKKSISKLNASKVMSIIPFNLIVYVVYIKCYFLMNLFRISFQLAK